MDLVKQLHYTVRVLAFLLTLVVAGQSTQGPESLRTAKQITAAANDKSESFDERLAALASLTEAATVFQNAGDNPEAARTLNRVGRLQLDLNQPDKAIESHNRALILLRQKPLIEVEIDNLNGLAIAQVRLVELAAAETAIRRAIKLSEESGYKAGEAEALLTLSDRQNFINHDLALETARKALAVWIALGDRVGIANVHTQMGQYFMALDNLSESIQNYEKALAMWREQGNKREQAGALIALGFIEWRKGDWQSCISFLNQARTLLDERADPLKMGQIAIGMGESFNESGMPEIGFVHSMRGLDYYRQAQKPDFEAYALFVIVRTQYLMGNYADAERQLRQILDLEKDKKSVQSGQCHEMLGRIFLATATYQDALTHLESAAQIYQRSKNPRELAQVFSLIGQANQKLGNPDRARQYFDRALESFTRLSDRVNLSVIYFALGRLEMTLGNLDAAENYLKQSIDVTENLRRVPSSSDLTTAISATVHERYETYIDCLMRKHKAQPNTGYNVRAFEISEQSRGRALVDLLRATQTATAPGLDPQLASQEKQIRQSLRVKEDSRAVLLARGDKKEALDALELEIARLETEYKQTLETIRSSNSHFELMDRPVGLDIQRIQESVISDDDTLVLEYSLGRERSYVWAVTRNAISSHELPSQNLINEVVQRVYKMLTVAPTQQVSNDLQLAARELSQIVLSPVAAKLSKRRILIVADGALNYIPFQVLPSPSDNGKQLLVEHEIINAPSVTILGQLRQETMRRQPATNTLAAFGDPVFAPDYALRNSANGNDQLAYVGSLNDGRMRSALRDVELTGDKFDPSLLQPLFYAKRELANIRDVAGSETLLATGFDATREKLRQTDLTKFSVLHFATHGVLDPKRPENSGLFLSTVNREGQSQDGFVGLSEIYDLRAPVDLVVLSACRTGLGKDVRGEGLIGITRGFMYAGASSVVASLWKVDDEATAELMKNFYSNMLQHGMPPAAALRAAQKSIRQQERWSSPYYWAAFTLQGEYRQTVKPRHARAIGLYQNILTGVVLLVLMVGATVWYRNFK